MSVTHDPDRLLQAFLDEGPEVLPDRVLEAVADDIHGQRQRTVFGPWRLSTMRTFLASAAVLAIVVAGAGLFLANRPAPGPAPSPTPESLPSQGSLVPGARYDTGIFSQPFTFTLPAGFGDGDVRGEIWPDRHTLDLQIASGGAVTFHDETVLTDDPCHIAGTIPDVPDDVGAWLTGSGGSTVSAPVQVSESVRPVTYWDSELGGTCFVGDPELLPTPGPGIWFCSHERHRVYDVDLEPITSCLSPGPPPTAAKETTW
jgi:hypothetical protein